MAESGGEEGMKEQLKQAMPRVAALSIDRSRRSWVSSATLWPTNGANWNITILMDKSAISGQFSIAMLNYQRYCRNRDRERERTLLGKSRSYTSHAHERCRLLPQPGQLSSLGTRAVPETDSRLEHHCHHHHQEHEKHWDDITTITTIIIMIRIITITTTTNIIYEEQYDNQRFVFTTIMARIIDLNIWNITGSDDLTVR